MKRITLFLVASLALIMGCSGNSDSLSQDSVTVDSTIQVEKQFTINKDGIDPIVLGLPIEKIPASVEGLYDSFTKDYFMGDEYDPEYYILEFFRDGKKSFQATAEDATHEHKFVISHVTLLDKDNLDIKVEINGKLYGCRDNVAELIQNKVITQDPYYSMIYTYQGIDISLETDNLKKPEMLNITCLATASTEYQTPTIDDLW